MWVWVAFCCVAVAVGATVTKDCDMISADGDTYREETLVGDLNIPMELAVDYATDLLYFSYQKEGVWFTAKLDLRTKSVNNIKELTGRCRFAVDQVLQEVHAGCFGDSDGRGAGLYRFDSNVDRFVLVGEAMQPVRFIYYNNVLYYSLFDSLLLRTFRKDLSVRVQDVTSPVYNLVIDKHKDWIFYNSTGLYRQRPSAVGATRYAGVNWLSGLAVDTRGNAYVCDQNDGIHHLPRWTPNTTKLLDARCCDLTFDRDNNIIYGDDNNRKIVRLVKCWHPAPPMTRRARRDAE